MEQTSQVVGSTRHESCLRSSEEWSSGALPHVVLGFPKP
jgi:hypothetical protein